MRNPCLSTGTLSRLNLSFATDFRYNIVMLSIHELIDHFSARHHARLQQVTQPLSTHFGISYFCFQRVKANGAWTILGNKPDWLNYSAGKHFYRVDPSLIHPSHYQTGLNFPSTHQHSEFQATLGTDCVKKFDINHPLAIIDRQFDYCDFYFFGAPTAHSNVLNSYINHVHLLKDRYPEYFKHACRDLIAEMDDHAVDLNQLKPESFAASSNVLKILASIENDFLHDITNNSCLSHREQQCLMLYRTGLSAKESAPLLGISYRTVEAHMNSIKRKLGVKHKRELLRTAL